MTRARTACPACGYAEDGIEYVCRRCGTYLRDPPVVPPNVSRPPSSNSTLPDSRARDHAISVALREPEALYEATRVPEVKTDPGGEVRFIARVTNLSPIVDGVTLHVEGVPDSWAEVRPGTLHVLPFRSGEVGHEAEAEVGV